MRLRAERAASRSLCRYANGETKSKYQSSDHRDPAPRQPARAAQRDAARYVAPRVVVEHAPARRSRRACASSRCTGRSPSSILHTLMQGDAHGRLGRAALMQRAPSRRARARRASRAAGRGRSEIVRPASRSFVEVDAGLDAEAVQQVDDVLGRDVAGRALRVRTAAEPRDARVERRDAELEARVDVRERLPVGVVEMAAHLVDRVHARAPLPSRAASRPACRRRSCRRRRHAWTPMSCISRATYPTASGVDLALVRAAERAGDRAAHAHAARRAPPRRPARSARSTRRSSS